MKVVDLTLPLTRDPDPRVRTAAYGVFSSWLDSADATQHPWRRQYIDEALHDEDCIVRSIVLGALEHAATAADAAVALAAYARAQRDSQSDARVAALRLLATAWAHDSARFPDSVTAAIARLAEHDIPVSMFIAADKKQIDASREVGAVAIELHTGAYADAPTAESPGVRSLSAPRHGNAVAGTLQASGHRP